jgi:hypothetical protein
MLQLKSVIGYLSFNEYILDRGGEVSYIIIIIIGITKRVIIIVFIDKENISFDANLVT